MPTLHVFNPEHDFALAFAKGVYTPPKRIKDLRRKLELLPLYRCMENDLILTSSDKLLIVDADFQLKETSIKDVEITKIEPWGWDFSVVKRLVSLGIDPSLTADEEFLNDLRRLSHRRISIEFNEFLGFENLPVEISSEEEFEVFLSRHPEAFFKAPWSSSGRGVVSSTAMTGEKLRQWILGAVERQGSVMAEAAARKRLDFATLWIAEDGRISFRGFSLMKLMNNGDYAGNFCAPQQMLKESIERQTSDSLDDVVGKQKEFLEARISPFYEGRLGIDMLIDESGKIWPCLELNLRNTMGHMALDYLDYLERTNAGIWKNDVHGLFYPLEER